MKRYHIFKNSQQIASTATREGAVSLIRLHQKRETIYSLRKSQYSIICGKEEFVSYPIELKGEKTMTIKNYANICKKFSADTAEWLDLDNYKHYMTDGASDWYESCDACHGGIDVSWAFHESDEQIDKLAESQFRNAIRELIELGRDDGWMDEQWDAVIDLLS